MIINNWIRIIITCSIVMILGYFLGRVGIGFALAFVLFVVLRPLANILSRAMLLKTRIICILVGFVWGIIISLIFKWYINFLDLGIILTIVVYMAGLYFSIVNYDVLGQKHPSVYGFNFLNYSSILAFTLFSFILIFTW